MVTGVFLIEQPTTGAKFDMREAHPPSPEFSSHTVNGSIKLQIECKLLPSPSPPFSFLGFPSNSETVVRQASSLQGNISHEARQGEGKEVSDIDHPILFGKPATSDLVNLSRSLLPLLITRVHFSGKK